MVESKATAEQLPVIWVDLDNSPHVPFFAPILKELQARGYPVWVTASSRYQVDELATMHGIRHESIKGGYYGKNKILKAAGLLRRALLLHNALPQRRPMLAVSHGSRSQVIAANMAGIPVAVIIDYEYAQFPFLRVDCVITPDVIPQSPVSRFGCFCRYHGLKEDVYVPEFKPDGTALASLDVDPDKVIATIRPPATDAHYHNPESEELLTQVVQHISARSDCVMILLPRNENQEREIREQWGGLIGSRKLIIPPQALSGLSLIWESDLVVSGGGTMNREAAALGVPVYSIFRGKIGAVDHYLADSGRMTLIESAADVGRLMVLCKRQRQDLTTSNTALQQILSHLEALARNLALAAPTLQ